MSSFDTLRGLPAFHEFEDDELALIDRLLTVQEVADGHVFLREGKGGAAVTAQMFVVLSGAVSVTRGARDLQVELQRLEPGEIFGAMALLDQAARSAGCEAVGPTVVGSVARTLLDEVFNSRTPAAATFQHLVARQLARKLRTLTDSLKAAQTGEFEPLARELGLPEQLAG